MISQTTVQLSDNQISPVAVGSLSLPSSSSDVLSSGALNTTGYVDLATRTVSYMQSNTTAPSNMTTSLGSMGYQSEIYLFSRILSYYQTNGVLPTSVGVRSWSTSNLPIMDYSFTVDQITSTAQAVKGYVETYKTLPTLITVNGIQLNQASFLYLITETTLQVSNNKTSALAVSVFSLPSSGSDQLTNGAMNTNSYLSLANQVITYMKSNNMAPSYSTISLGSITYQSQIYLYSRILYYYRLGVLPQSVNVKSWSSSNIPILDPIFTVDQTTLTSKQVTEFVTSSKTLPTLTTVGSIQLNQAQFLYLITQTTLNLYNGKSCAVEVRSYSLPSGSSESLNNGALNTTNYMNLANQTLNYMKTGNSAPSYTNTTLGSMCYQSQIYLYSRTLNYYYNMLCLPTSISVRGWTTSNLPILDYGFTMDQITSTAQAVKGYVETYKTLPTLITVGSVQLNQASFLNLITQATNQLYNNKTTPVAVGTFNLPSSSSDTLNNGALNTQGYASFASTITSYMNANNCAPSYTTMAQGRMTYQSEIYLFCRVLNYYRGIGVLPTSVGVMAWSSSNIPIIDHSKTVDQITTTAQAVKGYVETYNTLPTLITVDGVQFNQAQYLYLIAETILQLSSGKTTPIAVASFNNPSNPSENITNGIIFNEEYLQIAGNITSLMNLNSTAPKNITNTSLLGSIRFESLIYMYSQVLTYYKTNTTLPNQINVIPWVAVTSPNGTYNFQTAKVFTSIQAAINDATTKNGDTITLGKTSYTESIILTKKLTILPLLGNVTITAANTSLPVITINQNGNTSNIMNLNIIGSTGNSGIYINNSSNNTITNNNITGNQNGLYLNNSSGTQITGNNITSNTARGIYLSSGSNNTITTNIITNNQDGIYIYNSPAEIHFNQITGNTRYGLYNTGSCTVNATNNWWGTNSPIVLSSTPSDICVGGGEVNHTSWLVLNVNATPNTISGAESVLTADLTKNNNNDDTSSSGHVPDGIPVNFTTNLGTVTTTAYTRNGKASSVLRLNGTLQSGTATVTAGLNKQNSTTTVTKVPATMNITITSTGINLSNYPHPLNLTVTIPINSSITWVSIVCRETDEPGANYLNILVNGNTILTRAIMGSTDDYTDNLQTTITYPCGTLTKNETIYYTDGPDAGFETIQTFAIATGKVTDDMVQYWLNQKNATVNGTLLYPAGYKKAAYGTFMTALTTLFVSDVLSDDSALKLDVNWARSSPTVVMVFISDSKGYVNCLDPSMGMTVNGDVGKVKLFRFLSSLILSEIENTVLSLTGLPVESSLSMMSSTTIDTITNDIYNLNKTYEEINIYDKYLSISLPEDSEHKIVVDLETGLVKDILGEIKGAKTLTPAYCFHDQLTDKISDFLNSDEFQQYLDYAMYWYSMNPLLPFNNLVGIGGLPYNGLVGGMVSPVTHPVGFLGGSLITAGVIVKHPIGAAALIGIGTTLVLYDTGVIEIDQNSRSVKLNLNRDRLVAAGIQISTSLLAGRGKTGSVSISFSRKCGNQILKSTVGADKEEVATGYVEYTMLPSYVSERINYYLNQTI